VIIVFLSSSEKLCIPLGSIKEGISKVSFKTRAENIELKEGCLFPDELNIEIQITVVGEDYLLDFFVESEGEFVCDRCGVEFRHTIRGELKTLYTFDTKKCLEYKNDDVKMISKSVREIDISQEVIDALGLAIPAKILCKTSCAGLCVKCGTNLNERKCKCKHHIPDHRWDGLKKIKFD
jgi:uncharacterized protein